MLDRLVNAVRTVVASVVAWQINERHERAAMRVLEAAHVGAIALTVWAEEIREQPGRHSLRVALHH